MRLSYELSSFQNPLVLAEELAKPFESCSLSAYWDPAGFPTNGWGNLLSRTTKKSLMKSGLTQLEADEWLRYTYPDISQAEADNRFTANLLKSKKSVLKLVRVSLTNNQIAALIDFAFNLGAGNLQSSTLLRLINRGDMLSACDEFPKWNKAGGVVYRGLTRRRIAEKNLFRLDV